MSVMLWVGVALIGGAGAVTGEPRRWGPRRHDRPADREPAVNEDCLKLTTYFGERQRTGLHNGQPVHRALVRRLRQSGARGATTLRGMWGFHGTRAPHGDRLLQLGRGTPVVTIIIDKPDRIASSFDIIDEFTTEHGVVTS